MSGRWRGSGVITTFLLASVLLAVTPGPAVIYLLTRTLAHGRRAGFASLAGVALGNFANALAASTGLAALFAVSAVAFTVVKYAGALYLVYLGLRVLLEARPGGGVGAIPQAHAAWAVFRDGFMVALLNPKTALFFAALLPQFIDPSWSPLLQSVMLGGLFVLVAAMTDAAYVLVASRIAPRIFGVAAAASAASPGVPCTVPAASARGGRGRYLAAASFIGLGVYTAFGSVRGGK